MSAPPDLTTEIAAQALDPISSSSDGMSASGRAAADLIAIDRYLLAKAAAAQRMRGVRITKLIPPGCIPDNGGSCIVGVPFGGGVTG